MYHKNYTLSLSWNILPIYQVLYHRRYHTIPMSSQARPEVFDIYNNFKFDVVARHLLL